MTVDAKTHVEIYFAFGCGLFGHVAVAGGTVDSGADVRRVIEAHMRRVTVAVDAHPGNFFAAGFVGGDFLDLRTVGGDGLVAAHAHGYTGNARLRALIHADVAKGTGQTFGEMDGVGVGDGLDRVLRMDVEEMS